MRAYNHISKPCLPHLRVVSDTFNFIPCQLSQLNITCAFPHESFSNDGALQIRTVHVHNLIYGPGFLCFRKQMAMVIPSAAVFIAWRQRFTCTPSCRNKPGRSDAPPTRLLAGTHRACTVCARCEPQQQWRLPS
jgi:hypothetical protein